LFCDTISTMMIAFYKPYGVLSQFTPDHPGQRTLAEFKFPKNVYPVGRLDLDSEGLLLLSDEKDWTDWLLNPQHAHERTYHVQVERQITEDAVKKLRNGVLIQGEKTKPCQAKIIPDPGYPERNPPIRYRKSVPTSWIELKLSEGKNRQIRRMTAAAGFPTLRLIRAAIGNLTLAGFKESEGRVLNDAEKKLVGSF